MTILTNSQINICRIVVDKIFRTQTSISLEELHKEVLKIFSIEYKDFEQGLFQAIFDGQIVGYQIENNIIAHDELQTKLKEIKSSAQIISGKGKRT